MGDRTPLWVLLTGGLLLAALLIKAGLRALGLPALVGYLALGIAARAVAEAMGGVGVEGHAILSVLGTLGVIALLFRVGLESDLRGLLRQLRTASPIWLGDVAVCFAVGYGTARYGLDLAPPPSLAVATALTATSVGIPARVWQRMGLLRTPDGERFLDVAELDDLSGVVLMALLFALLPALRDGAAGDGALLVAAGRELGAVLLAMLGLGGACFLFSVLAERRFTAFFARFDRAIDPALPVAALGVIVAALAALAGFSVAIGAFFAGLVFSRDPDRVRIDASFGSIYELVVPFFFLGVGFHIAPEALRSGLATGAVLALAAVAGKLVGVGAPAWLTLGRGAALPLGLSMVPRAEIAMLVMERGRALGDGVVPEAVYAGVVVVSAVTCVGAPPLLERLLRRRGAAAGATERPGHPKAERGAAA